MTIASLLVLAVALRPVAAIAEASAAAPIRCQSIHLGWQGADIDKVIDRDVVRAHMQSAGLIVTTAESAQLTVIIASSPGSMQTARGGYYQTCLRAAATYRLRGATQAAPLARTCPVSGTEVTPDFARSGALDQWSAGARSRFTKLTLAALDEALERLRFGVAIESEPPGAIILRDAQLTTSDDGRLQSVGGVALESRTPTVIGCLARDHEITGVLTKVGYDPVRFTLRASADATQQAVVMTKEAPPAPASAETAAPAEPESAPGLLLAVVGGIGVLLAVVLFRVLRRKSAATGIVAGTVGSYELIDRLGSGGMGEVWRAQHTVLRRMAAVKLIRAEILDGDPEGITRIHQRFEIEAKATAALRSPHTIELYDYGTTADGSFYYAMELLQGMELETLVERFGPMPASRMIYLICQACAALDEAHAVGLVHRDIKPANVFASCLGTSYDFVKVLDFGIVKTYAQQSTTLTARNALVGTPAFVAPETLRSDEVIDGRADIYALGCLAYWLLTGTLVFEGDLNKVLFDHVNTAPQSPSLRTELEIPQDVEAVVLSCLAKSPESRPQRAHDLAAALADCECAAQWTATRAAQWWHENAPIQLVDAGRTGSA